MTDSRPGNKTPSVKFSVESDVQVKNKQFVCIKGKLVKNEIRKHRGKKNIFEFFEFRFS